MRVLVAEFFRGKKGRKRGIAIGLAAGAAAVGAAALANRGTVGSVVLLLGSDGLPSARCAEGRVLICCRCVCVCVCVCVYVCVRVCVCVCVCRHALDTDAIVTMVDVIRCASTVAIPASRSC